MIKYIKGHHISKNKDCVLHDTVGLNKLTNRKVTLLSAHLHTEISRTFAMHLVNCNSFKKGVMCVSKQTIHGWKLTEVK